MKQKLQSRLTQHFTLTPQLQQSIRLLQLSSTELNEEIERLLEENPLLERLDDSLLNTTRFQGDGSLIRQKAPEPADSNTATDGLTESTLENASSDSLEHADFMAEERQQWEGLTMPDRQQDDEHFRPQLEAPPKSLKDHLQEQLRVSIHDHRKRVLVELLIDALDIHGYLLESLEEMQSWLPAELHVSMQELEEALACLQSFEPAGVGARDSTECLALQIKTMPDIPFIIRRYALEIVEHHLKAFAQHDFSRLKKAVGCDDEDLVEIRQVILNCNPHPGAAYATDTADTVIPEVIACRKEDGKWHAELNTDAMPKIRINQLYGDILKNASNRSTLNTRFQEAKWLIRNISQRFDTILKVSEAIIERQQSFFTAGPASMRPLVLREIADTLGLHESTVSRVTAQKYMMTPLGIFELKHFFGSHLMMEGGGETSATAIREKIRQLIATEDKKKPYSDSKIAQLLEKEGLAIARRTVAKYRDVLKIPPASLRKSL
ncbi:MAG: RNA polymerase factor sigma-54 [Oxalobacter sp.]|nr:RNA polymerase factor sigma-54 [Oxalobacter sp.]